MIDDYAHHPTEIKATLTSAKNYPHKKTWCIFQPHTYTRTKALLPEFAEALTLADHVVLANIYAARETDTLGISSADLQKKPGTGNSVNTSQPSMKSKTTFWKTASPVTS